MPSSSKSSDSNEPYGDILTHYSWSELSRQRPNWIRSHFCSVGPISWLSHGCNKLFYCMNWIRKKICFYWDLTCDQNNPVSIFLVFSSKHSRNQHFLTELPPLKMWWIQKVFQETQKTKTIVKLLYKAAVHRVHYCTIGKSQIRMLNFRNNLWQLIWKHSYW